MKLIVTSTNRKNSLTAVTAQIVQKIYQNLKEDFEILDLRDIPFEPIVKEPYSSQAHPSLKIHLDKVAQSTALVIICPEYNGGIPGLIKHFIDHWIYPDSFVYKPVCFIGLGGKFGALNPISHLQSIFLYRHSFVFPIRVFIQNVSQVIKEEKILDDNVNQLLVKQARNFIKYITALKNQNFD